jgi:hypothetical protein
VDNKGFGLETRSHASAGSEDNEQAFAKFVQATQNANTKNFGFDLRRDEADCVSAGDELSWPVMAK